MAAYRSYLALSGFDRQCQGYIAEYAGKANVFAGKGKVVVAAEGGEKAKIGSAELPEGIRSSDLRALRSSTRFASASAKRRPRRQSAASKREKRRLTL